jgi:RES domain-containing protein
MGFCTGLWSRCRHRRRSLQPGRDACAVYRSEIRDRLARGTAGLSVQGAADALCAYEVDCEDILDLTDTASLSAHGITSADLACPWKDLSTRGIKPPTWEITERLFEVGTSGVIVPRFAKGAVAADVNAVFWDWAPDPPHQVRVIDDDRRLPRDASSWR